MICVPSVLVSDRGHQICFFEEVEMRCLPVFHITRPWGPEVWAVISSAVAAARFQLQSPAWLVCQSVSLPVCRPFLYAEPHIHQSPFFAAMSFPIKTRVFSIGYVFGFFLQFLVGVLLFTLPNIFGS